MSTYSLKDALALHGVRKVHTRSWGGLDKDGCPFLSAWSRDVDPAGRKSPPGMVRVNLWSADDAAGMQTPQAKERLDHIALLRSGKAGRVLVSPHKLDANGNMVPVIVDPWRVWDIVGIDEPIPGTFDALLRLADSDGKGRP